MAPSLPGDIRGDCHASWGLSERGLFLRNKGGGNGFIIAGGHSRKQAAIGEPGEDAAPSESANIAAAPPEV